MRKRADNGVNITTFKVTPRRAELVMILGVKAGCMDEITFATITYTEQPIPSGIQWLPLFEQGDLL